MDVYNGFGSKTAYRRKLAARFIPACGGLPLYSLVTNQLIQNAGLGCFQRCSFWQFRVQPFLDSDICAPDQEERL